MPSVSGRQTMTRGVASSKKYCELGFLVAGVERQVHEPGAQAREIQRQHLPVLVGLHGDAIAGPQPARTSALRDARRRLRQLVVMDDRSAGNEQARLLGAATENALRSARTGSRSSRIVIVCRTRACRSRHYSISIVRLERSAPPAARYRHAFRRCSVRVRPRARDCGGAHRARSPIPAASSSFRRPARARTSRGSASSRMTTTASSSRARACTARRCSSPRRTSATSRAASASGTAAALQCDARRGAPRARRRRSCCCSRRAACGCTRRMPRSSRSRARSSALLDARVDGIPVVAVGVGKRVRRHVGARLRGRPARDAARHADRTFRAESARIGARQMGARRRRSSRRRGACSARGRATRWASSNCLPTMPTRCAHGSCARRASGRISRPAVARDARAARRAHCRRDRARAAVRRARVLRRRRTGRRCRPPLARRRVLAHAAEFGRDARSRRRACARCRAARARRAAAREHARRRARRGFGGPRRFARGRNAARSRSSSRIMPRCSRCCARRARAHRAARRRRSQRRVLQQRAAGAACCMRSRRRASWRWSRRRSSRVTGLPAATLIEDDPLLGQPVRHFAAQGGVDRHRARSVARRARHCRMKRIADRWRALLVASSALAGGGA